MAEDDAVGAAVLEGSGALEALDLADAVDDELQAARPTPSATTKTSRVTERRTVLLRSTIATTP
ncbi:MAG: hypothetical protein M0032_09920 [Actinomycetota bacterium]|nr:hypothetical protein [Actinomycetota bacterium]MDA8294322.1 hypothetical protein [Actinomycetota bacterium]